VTATTLVSAGTIVGIPLGVILGRWLLWGKVLRAPVSIPSDPRTAWFSGRGGAPITALIIAIAVANRRRMGKPHDDQ